MSALHFPGKYHTVWLDRHIGNHGFYVQLKHIFFTQIDPNSAREFETSDTDGDPFKKSDEERPVTFENSHFTLNAFTNEDACFEYIDTIKSDRILFITSNTLGKSAVSRLLKKYYTPFINEKTNEIYNSIYVFCSDSSRAKEWAIDYVKYVKICTSEIDLLAIIIRDLAIEFLKHGRQLLDANQNEAALERLTWSRKLFIRRQKLDARYGLGPGLSETQPFSLEIEEIDRLLELASIPVMEDSSEATTYITAITCEQMKDAEDYIRQYILAWLDKALGDDKSALDISLGMLRNLQQVFTFNDAKKCLDYLSTVTDKRVFLVLTYAIENELLNQFLALAELEYIYLFGKEGILKKHNSKLIEISSIEELYSRLNKDMPSTTEEDRDTDFTSLKLTSTAKSIEELDDARLFIFYQFLTEVLLHLPKTDEIKENFISFCREKTNDNPTQQEILEKIIKNYKSSEAISEYTSTSCLHRLLNRTCRLGNIKDMFRMAFYMTDLYAQLKELHNEQSEWGKAMLMGEFKKLAASIGDLVVTKSFLSTTTKREVAAMYSGRGTLDPEMVPAILHMKIDARRNETKPFAYIRYYSNVRADDEVLISLGTVFRVAEKNQTEGIDEFVLVRSDAEETLEREIKDGFHDQMRQDNVLSNVTSSADARERIEEVLDTMMSSSARAVKENVSSNDPFSFDA
ncbi:unnamed protein product [Rotaria socialis]|uniref:Uncharacterized protein n=1 Tax=Rotaria socialis TaxID=392032 RepID=A0A817XZL5_9BILA|nr:unnamed protein product [Rotaria socialis]